MNEKKEVIVSLKELNFLHFNLNQSKNFSCVKCNIFIQKKKRKKENCSSF